MGAALMSDEQHNQIDFNFIGVGSLLSSQHFQVPAFQRSYSWEEKQVKELFDDIVCASIKDKANAYFIGTIVSTKKDQFHDIIDGQQRFATISMILSAIRDYYFVHSDSERATQIEGSYLCARILRTLEQKPRLKLNQEDNEFFISYVIENPDKETRKKASPKYSSNEKIIKAFDVIKEQLEHFINSNPPDELITIVEFIHDHLKVAHISVNNESNAYLIFETLNDRGLSLAISDLLKNYLFGLAEDRLYEVQSNWNSMFSLLDTHADPNLFINFLRHYWAAKYKIVREKELYSEIKKNIKTKTNAIALSGELNKYATIYLALLQSDNEFWNNQSNKTRRNIRTFNELGFVQIRPLLLAIASTLKKNQVEKATTLLVSTTVRLLIKGTSGSGAIEDSYCRTANKILSGTITNVSQLKAELKSVIPNNLSFKNSFLSVKVSRASLARYYLITIETCLAKESQSELTPFENEELISLEHVLPQKLN